MPQQENSRNTLSQERLLKRLDNYARLLDSRFRIPGTSVNYGWDAIIGLIPVLGDILTFIFSATIIVEARLAGAPFKLILKMLANSVIELIIGMIPLLGDGFDVLWKANLKNVELLRQHLEKTTKPPQAMRKTSGKLITYSWILLIPAMLFMFYWMGSVNSDPAKQSPESVPSPAPPVDQQKLDHSPHDKSAAYTQIASLSE